MRGRQRLWRLPHGPASEVRLGPASLPLRGDDQRVPVWPLRPPGDLLPGRICVGQPQRLHRPLISNGDVNLAASRNPTFRCPLIISELLIMTTRINPMSFNFRSLRPNRTKWLETRVCYIGRGRAVFTDPPGVIEGSATVTFTRGGRAKVSLTPDRVEPDPLPLHLGRSRGEDRRNGMQNPCSLVEVRSEIGVFSSTTDRVFLGDGSTRAEVGQVVELYPLRSEFVVPNETRAAFWVLPLTNFVMNY